MSAAFADEQRLLGVGVRIQRRTDAHLRHQAAIAAHAHALVRGAVDPVPDLLEARLARLRQRLWRSPFWLDTLRAAALSPDDLRTLADLRHFPLLDRDVVGARAAELPTLDAHEDPELSVATSSGSSGKALEIVKSGYDGLHMWAILRFWVERLRIELPPRPRVVLLCTLPGGLEYSTRLRHFEDGALHRISTVRPRPLERLLRARPALLFGDPAGLHWLLGQPRAPDPALVLTSAQHLAPALRDAVQGAFRAPIVDYYATTETGPIAWACPQAPGVFHVFHPDVWVESVNHELVVTRLRDSVVPLVRYRPGDAGEVIDGACRCGAVGRSIIGFTGRRACAFRTPAGLDVDAWQLCWLFKDLPLVGYQLTQTGPERFHLQVDRDLPLPRALFATRLVHALQRMGFRAPEVDIAQGPLPAAPSKPEPYRRDWHVDCSSLGHTPSG